MDAITRRAFFLRSAVSLGAAAAVLSGCNTAPSDAAAITPMPTPTPSPTPSPSPISTSLRPTSLTQGIHNESLGPENTQIGATTHHIHYEDVTDGLEFWWWPGRATAGEGEIGPALTVTARASVNWTNVLGGSMTTQLDAASGGNSAAASIATDFLKFRANIRPKVGTHLFVNFWGTFPAGGVYSHGKADYVNGDRLQYGPSVPDNTSSGVPYSNTYSGACDYFGPCFIGGRGSRPTFVNDGDSQEAGVLSGEILGDISDTPYGSHGAWGRLLAPYMAGINISVAGATAREMADPLKTAVRDVLAKMCQLRAHGLGVNDIIFQGGTSDQVASWEATRTARIGLPTITKTINPVLIDEKTNRPLDPAQDTERNRENLRRRALSGTYDPASIVENGSSGTTNNLAYYVDGTHNSALGNKAPLATYDAPTRIPGTTLVPADFPFASYTSPALSDGWVAQQATLNSSVPAQTATILTEDATNTSHVVFKQIPLSLASVSKIFSFYARRESGARNLAFQIQKSDFSGLCRITINLGTGARVFSDVNAAGMTIVAFAAELAEGYWKIVVTVASDASVPTNPYVFFRMADAAGADSYQGDGTSSLMLKSFDAR